MRRRVTWLLVPLAWALACGGRFEQTVSGDGDAGTTSTGQGGSAPAKAGSASRAGSTGQAATTGRGGSKATGAGANPGTGASTASGGAPSAGGAIAGGAYPIAGSVSSAGAYPTAGSVGNGGGGVCAPIACAQGYLLVPNPDGRCFHCEIDFNNCEMQRQSYLQYREPLLVKSSGGCTFNADCTMYYEKNACGVSSCGVSVTKFSWDNLNSNLNAYAQMACNPACPPAPEPPCDPSPAPECYKGYCD